MRLLNERNIALALVAATIIVIGVSVVMLARFRDDADAPTQSVDASEEIAGFSYQLVGFGDLEGWRSDETAESIPAFVRTCDTFTDKLDETPLNPSAAALPGAPAGETLAGTVGDWRPACDAAQRMLTQIYADENARTSAARAFYEYYFRPVKLLNMWRRTTPQGTEEFARSDGLITAYFEPHYQASDVWTSEFSAPVYFRPDDLISVDLGKFRPELAGQRVAGRIAGNSLEPYPDHAEINDGALAGRARVLAYMRPNDLFFLQIQGSGRLLLNGRDLRVGYDGANGQPYTAIGRVLLEKGALQREEVSMQSILDWLQNATEEEARAVREANQSYIFFRILEDLPHPDLGPIGSAGVQLTAGRSLAVDPRYTAYGAPVWVSIPGDPSVRKDPVRRLLIAQDSGGAIKNAVRADIFVGSGDLAGDVAGGFNERGELYLLAPAKIVDRLPAGGRS